MTDPTIWPQVGGGVVVVALALVTFFKAVLPIIQAGAEDRTKLWQRIDHLEARMESAENRADTAVAEARTAVARAEECEQREGVQKSQIAALQRQLADIAGP